MLRWLPLLRRKISEMLDLAKYSTVKATFVEDWIARSTSNNVEFKSIALGTSDRAKGSIDCRLSCYHEGNYISAHGFGDKCGDAFHDAIANIEKTIGTGWRA